MRLRLDAVLIILVQPETGDCCELEVGRDDLDEAGLLHALLELGEVNDVLMAATFPLLGRLEGDAPSGELFQIEAVELLIEFLPAGIDGHVEGFAWDDVIGNLSKDA